MGEKNSKPSCITYEEGVKRISPVELQRLKEAFKRSSGSGNQILSKSAFIQDVLCESVPPSVADWLFVACGGTSKGIAFKELVCGLVLLTKGTIDERIRFLWTLYCNDSGTHIIKSDFQRQLQIEATYQSNNILTTQAFSNPQAIFNKYQVSLFGQSDRVVFEQFKSWITIHKDATVLSKWLLVDASVHLTSDQETPTFYQSLAGVTHLEEEDIEDLEKMFWNLKGSAITGQLDRESLSPLISPPVPRQALDGVFLAFDENRDGHIDFKELCCGVSAACRGPSVERMKFCFKIFDTDRDAVLNFAEVQQMIEILLSVAEESTNDAFKTLTYEQIMRELYIRATKQHVESSEETTPTQELAVPSIPEFQLTQEDFLMWSVESPLNVVQPFLDLLFEVCHIVLGLKPQCKHLENEIVRGWLTREARRGQRVGQFWYLVAGDWWQNWLTWTQSTVNSSCTHCKANARNVDEAMVCDESFTSNSTESMGDLLNQADNSSLGSSSSGISLGRQMSSAPGPIDNMGLITQSPYKTAKALTGEGGRLKRDTPLVQHRDFEILPESLWKYLYLKYGGNLPLPRQVIQPTNSSQLELELYPLNLRVLRHHVPNNQGNNAPFYSAISGGYGALASSNYTSFSSVSSALQPPKKYLAYTAAFSKLATVRQVDDFLCQNLKLKPEDFRLWHVTAGPGGESISNLLEEEHLSLSELEIADNDEILLEVRNKDLTWPEELGSLAQNHPSTNVHERRGTVASIMSTHAPGATGLHNLGNTCFMNSALQVLFNTQPLTQYFIQNMHMFEVNSVNKLGTKGQLAMRYAELLKEVWTAASRSIAPLKLRFCVTKYAHQFAGGGQHDSQELLAWLLDALHEDLNRVTEKPYTELKDSNGRADALVAAEAWSQHHARNQSVIVDLFYGQLKSKVSCLTCGNESVRFDPFSLLSLPLPVENYVYCEVLVIFLNGSVPIKYGLRLNSDSRYWDLKKQLSTMCGLDAEKMLICELAGFQIKFVFSNDQKIKAATAYDLTCYEVPTFAEIARSRADSEIAVNNIEQGLKDIQRSQDPHQLTTSSSVSSSVVSSSCDSADDEHANGTGGETNHNNNNNKNCKNSKSQLDASQCKCYHSENSKKRRPAKVRRCFGNDLALCMPQNFLCFKKEDEYRNSTTFKFTKIEETSVKTISTVNLLPTNGNGGADNVSIASSSPGGTNGAREGSPADGSTTTTTDGLRERCPTCGKFNPLDDDDGLAGGEGGGEMNGMRKNSESDDDCITMQIKKGSAESIVNGNRKTTNYLMAVHRNLCRQDTYFLSHHKSRPGLFGVPLLIPCFEGVTNKELYCSVWTQVSRLLSKLPPTPPDQANHATDCDDSLGYDFPFKLKAVAEGGRVCCLCPWSKFCRGCEIPCNDEPLLEGFLLKNAMESVSMSSRESTPKLANRSAVNIASLPSTNRITRLSSLIDLNTINIAIDWDPTALHLRYQSTRERIINEHPSVAQCRKQQTDPIDLDHCLRAFTSEEELEQWYHCSHCKGKQPATKKLQIWKLPPILIVHLKRFNYVGNKWVKSQKVVNFPFKNFDPTPYLASVPQETILRHRELLEQEAMEKKNLRNVDCTEEIEEFDRENDIENGIDEQQESEAEVLEDNKPKNEENTEPSSAPSDAPHKAKRISVSSMAPKKKPTGRRKRLVSTSLTKTPVLDTELRDYHNHHLKDGEDGFDLKYHLYAVVSHSGMLNGGHYVSYAANPNGSWYCYNDSSCREISQTTPNIDPSTAYLLFYERQGLNYVPYLPKIDGKQIPSVLEADDSDSDLKKMCVIA